MPGELLDRQKALIDTIRNGFDKNKKKHNTKGPNRGTEN